jgi:predicted nucleic acid-binding protein
MRKLKLYLDTSVVSFLDADDSPEKQSVTNFFWEDVKKDTYEIFLSLLVFAEINRCHALKKKVLINYLAQIRYTLLKETVEVVELALRYVSEGIIPERYRDDALHLAHATLARCDAVISWNFRHMVRFDTIRGVKGVNTLLGYPQIEIVTPQSFTEGV